VSKVFISYSRRDAEPVSLIAERLETAGHTVWLDKSTIQGGARWQEEILKGIEKADVFVLMLSPEAVESANVERELDLAYTTGKPILPLMLRRAAVPGHLEYAISGLDVVDISNETIENAAARLVSTLASPRARTRRAYGLLGHSRTQQFIYGTIYVAILTVAVLSPGEGSLGWWMLGAVVAFHIVRLGGGLFFYWLLKGLFIHRLTDRGVAISTRLAGFADRGLFQFPLWIVSEWTDPQTGKRHHFYSAPIWWSAEPFVPHQIRVIADPKHLGIYRMDLSFLPRTAGGIVRPSPRVTDTSSSGSSTTESLTGSIFVCHSDADTPTVAVLVRRLEAAGHVCMAARSDGRDFAAQERVAREIQHARLFLLLVSESSVREERVRNELDLATAYKRSILTVLLHQATLPTGMNYALAGARRIDLSHDLHSGLARLLEAIAAASPPATVQYKSRRLGLMRDVMTRVVREAGKAVTILGGGVLWYVIAVPLFKRLPTSSRASLRGLWANLQRRLGIWTDDDLRTHGTVLLTDYKTVESTGDGDRIVTQWCDPLSNQVYRFRSDPRPLDRAALRGIKTITVYAKPTDLAKYCMDLSFLPASKTQSSVVDRSTGGPVSGNEIFISYSTQDAAIAGLLSQQLKERGHKLLDLHAVHARPSPDHSIEAAIQRAAVFLLLVPSPQAIDVEAKAKELRVALSCNKRVVPVTFGGTEIPPSMQYRLMGIQCIEIGSDARAGVDRLLRALGPVDHVEDRSDRLQGEPYPRRTRFTGAAIGATSWGIGSVLPAFLLHGGRQRFSALVVGAVLGLLCGMLLGACCKPRMPKRSLVPLGIASFLIGMFVYLPSYNLMLSGDNVNGLALLANVVGYVGWAIGKTVEDRFLIHRLKKKGTLLLTEFTEMSGGQVVSEWRDPKTDEVHTFRSNASSRDPSTLVQTTTIAVFANPDNLSEYYMDLSFHSAPHLG
jgi:hypothetical protein